MDSECRTLQPGRIKELDALAQQAQRAFDAPISVISLVDAERTMFRDLFEVTIIPVKSGSVCEFTLERGVLTVIENLADDPVFGADPMVIEPPHLRFFAGAPFFDDAGQALGVLGVFDTIARWPEPAAGAELEAAAARLPAALKRAVRPRAA